MAGLVPAIHVLGHRATFATMFPLWNARPPTSVMHSA